MVSAKGIRAGKAYIEVGLDRTKFAKGLRQAESQLRNFGQKIQNLGLKMSMLGSAMSLPFVISGKIFTDFDDQMKTVQAVTRATGAEFDRLTEKAKLLGKTTAFTASQVASGMVVLGRQGFSSKEIDDGISSVLALARATGTDLAESAMYASDTMRAFGMNANELIKVADIMTATANNSAQTLEDLGQSMKYAAPVARQYGSSLKETANALGILANVGIKGSLAGTGMRASMTRLADPKIQKTLEGMGVSVGDAHRNMRGFLRVMKEVGAATQKLGSVDRLNILSKVFGRRALSAGASLTTESFERLEDAINNSAGTAQKTMAVMESGIGGAFRRLRSAVEGIAIAVGKTLEKPLILLMGMAKDISLSFIDWVKANKKLVTTLAATSAAILALGVSLTTLGISIQMVAWGLSGILKLFNVLPAAISLVVAGVYKLTVALYSLLTANPYLLAISLIALGAVLVATNKKARAAFDSIIDKMGQLIDAAKQIGQKIGSALVGGLGAIRNVFGVIKSGFSDLVGFIGGILSKAFKPLQGIYEIVKQEMGRIKTAFETISLKFGDGNLLGGVLAAFDTMFSQVKRGAVAMAGFFSGAIQKIIPLFLSMKDNILTMFDSAFRNLPKTLFNAFGTISKVFGAVDWLDSFMPMSKSAKFLVEALRGVVLILERVGQAGALLTGLLIKGMYLAGKGMQVVFAKALGNVIGLFKKMFRVVKAVVSFLASAFKPLFSVVKVVVSLWGTAFKKVVGIILTVRKALGRVTVAFLKFINLPARIVLYWGKVFKKIGNIIFDAVMGAFHRLVGGITGLVGVITGTARAIGDALVSALKGAVSFVKNIFQGIVSFVKTVAKGIGAAFMVAGILIKKAFGSVMGGVDAMMEKMKSLGGRMATTWTEVVDAMKRGDFKGASELIWAAIQMEWAKGIHALKSMWYGLKKFFVQTAADMAVGMVSAFYKAQEAMQSFVNEQKNANDSVTNTIRDAKLVLEVNSGNKDLAKQDAKIEKKKQDVAQKFQKKRDKIDQKVEEQGEANDWSPEKIQEEKQRQYQDEGLTDNSEQRDVIDAQVETESAEKTGWYKDLQAKRAKIDEEIARDADANQWSESRTKKEKTSRYQSQGADFKTASAAEKQRRYEEQGIQTDDQQQAQDKATSGLRTKRDEIATDVTQKEKELMSRRDKRDEAKQKGDDKLKQNKARNDARLNGMRRDLQEKINGDSSPEADERRAEIDSRLKALDEVEPVQQKQLELSKEDLKALETDKYRDRQPQRDEINKEIDQIEVEMKPQVERKEGLEKKLRAVNTDMTPKYSDEEKAGFQKQIAAIDEELAPKQQEIEVRQTKLEALDEDTPEEAEKRSEIEESIQGTKASMQEREDEQAALTKELSKLNGIMGGSQQTLNDSQANVDEKTAAYESKKNELQLGREAVEQDEADKEAMKNMTPAEQQSLKRQRIQEDHAKAGKEIETKRSEYADEQGKQRETSRKVTGAKKELLSLDNDDSAESEERKEALREQLKALAKEQTDRDSKMDELKGQIGAAFDKRADLEENMRGLHTKADKKKPRQTQASATERKQKSDEMRGKGPQERFAKTLERLLGGGLKEAQTSFEGSAAGSFSGFSNFGQMAESTEQERIATATEAISDGVKRTNELLEDFNEDTK